MTAGSTRLDPDELALLEEERDHLLASLEDLEREFASGDMDEVDYRELKDDYTVRTADVLDAIEERRALQRQTSRRPSRGRAAVVAVAVLAFAVVAGVLVAQGSGQRGAGPITGGLNSLRSDLARCQTTSFQDPDGGIDCYEDLLVDAPENVEALTYQGWAMIRAERIPEGAANFDRVVELDPDYPDVRVFRAIVAARAGDHERAAQEIDRFYRNDPAPAAVQILQSQGLEREIFIRLLDDATRACWLEAAGAEDRSGESDPAAFVDALGGCLDGVLAAQPENVDALVSRVYALLAPGAVGLEQAVELVDRAVAAEPDDANARLVRAQLALADGREDDSRADLEVLDELSRPTISFLIGGPEELRKAIGAAPSSTSTTEPAGDDPVRPTVPNRDGG